MSSMMSLVMLVPLGVLLAGLCPRHLANSHAVAFRRFATGLAATQLLVATLALCLLALSPADSTSPSSWQLTYNLLGYAGLFQFNGTIGLMFLLVSFIGWIICRYSMRYLDGEATQGRYYCWLMFTIGSVSCMVLAGDLLSFCALWSLTSVGLHQLLVHYPERAAAQRAAWTKFTVSRIGDAALLSAIALCYWQFGTLQFDELAQASQSTSTNMIYQVACALLAAGVIAKTAQVPFHTWLPLTMETPTPVSALMHAGIVNAGGYLIVRSSGFLSDAILAHALLVIVGTCTACLGSVVMLTQTSVKKKLAYSTIAQMGFMLMQCGIGAYTSAMLHLLAHSLYKAHAFLSSGEVIDQRKAMANPLPADEFLQRPAPQFVLHAGLFTVTMGLLWAIQTVCGLNKFSQFDGLVLSTVLCLGIAHWLTQVIAVGRPSLILRTALTALGAMLFYTLSFAIVGRFTAAQSLTIGWPWLQISMAVFVCLAFAALTALQIMLSSRKRVAGLQAWYVHAANGFYIESWLRKRVNLLWNS